MRIKRKKLHESSTTLRNNSKGRERCETYVQGHRLLHGTFGVKRVKYVSERTMVLCSKFSMFVNISCLAPKAF